MKRVVSTLITTLLLTSNLSAKASTVVAWGSYAGTNCPTDLTTATKIAAGSRHSLALRSDGTVLAWGLSGPNLTIPESVSNVVDIAAGFNHSLALRADGLVVAWGYNSYSQLSVPPDLTNAIAIAAGFSHSLALRADHTITNFGQYFNRDENKFVPYPIQATFTNIIAIAAGYDHDLLLLADHTVVGWGFDAFGQIDVPEGLTNVVAIAAGDYTSLALRADGTLVFWGYDLSADLSKLTNVTAIAAGNSHMLALKRDTTVFAWGKRDSFQCDVPPGLSNVVAIAAGAEHSLALVVEPVTEPVSLTVSNAFWNNGVFSVSLPTTQGKAYFLEYKNSLDDAVWTAFDPVDGDGGLMQLQDTTATEPQRFYRVRMQ